MGRKGNLPPPVRRRWVVPFFWLPVAALCLARAALSAPRVSAAAGAALLAAGVLLWQLLEYCLHRFLFHRAPQSPRAIVLHFLLHGCHHRYPLDTERLVFPPIPATWVAAAIYGALRALLPVVRPCPVGPRHTGAADCSEAL